MTISVNINLGERKFGKSTQIVDCLHYGDTDYTASTGLDISTNSFTPVNSDNKNVIMSGLLIGEGDGNIAVMLEGGGVMTLPFYVTAEQGCLSVLLGYRIKTIYNVAGGTTFSGKIWPIW